MSILFEAVEAWIQLVLSDENKCLFFKKEHLFDSLNGVSWEEVEF